MNQEQYNYWISNIPNIGPKKIELLLQYFESPQGVFHASKQELEKFQEIVKEAGYKKFSSTDVDSIIKSRDKEKIKDNYAKLEKDGIYFVSKEDNRYPKKLKEIYGAPFALYMKGNLYDDKRKSIAIVGSRECSPYGREMARYLSSEVAARGITVISGLARGIDTYAHQGALSVDGNTYAILGCGVDICYPRENFKWYMKMQEKGGIISEYPPKTAPLAYHFPMRNRIISGLSDGILVIEAKEKSGSLITVDMGLDQGKNVYALPGRATDRLSEGCNNLIKMGAKLVTSPGDILEDFIPKYLEKTDNFKKNNNELETKGKIVYACLSLEPKHLEEIAMQTKLPIDTLMEQLLLLELHGLVRQTGKNYYIKTMVEMRGQ
ncbi:MAG TPA: DNA-protecting protein DprA [Clostridiales bacterium]|nr:DNA-protecting protein DprA [Clostridiales bacterium]